MWLKKLEKELRAKGLDDIEIAKLLEITKQTHKISTTTTGKKVTEPKPCLLEVTNSCPGCQAVTIDLIEGLLIENSNSSTFKRATLEVHPTNIAKRTHQISLCKNCLRKEQLLTRLEKLLKDQPSHLDAFESLLQQCAS